MLFMLHQALLAPARIAAKRRSALSRQRSAKAES